MSEYRGFVIDQKAPDVWYVRRPGSWIEQMWAPRTDTPEAQERRIDQWHSIQPGAPKPVRLRRRTWKTDYDDIMQQPGTEED